MECQLAVVKKPADPLTDTKERVREWANWFRDRIENGYPPHSWEGRAHGRGGSAPNPAAAAHPLSTNEDAQEVEDRLNELGAAEPLLRDALIRRHVERRTNKDAARKCHCSRAAFHEQCNRAYWWLFGKLGV